MYHSRVKWNSLLQQTQDSVLSTILPQSGFQKGQYQLPLNLSFPEQASPTVNDKTSQN